MHTKQEPKSEIPCAQKKVRVQLKSEWSLAFPPRRWVISATSLKAVFSERDLLLSDEMIDREDELDDNEHGYIPILNE